MDLNTLRPADTTAAAIAAALQRAEAAVAEAEQGVSDARARRDGLLLDGTAAQLAAAEKLLTAARDLAERVAAMEGQLRTRLVAAEKAETFARLDATRAAADAAMEARDRWWQEQEPKLRATIAEGLRLSRANGDVREEWERQMQRAAKLYPEAAAAVAQPALEQGDTWMWPRMLSGALRV